MRTQVILAAMIGAGLAAFTGCSHGGALGQKVDAKAAEETQVKTSADLHAETKELINTAPGLTHDEREKLLKLRHSTHSQLRELYEESIKLRSVLVKDLITTQYNEPEVELIKTRMKDLEDKRLGVIFSAVEKANQILGHDASDHREVVDSFFEGHESRND